MPTLPPLSRTDASLRLVGIWAASLILTVVALVGGALLGPFLPEDDIVHCVKCLVILGLLPFVLTCLLSFRVLLRLALLTSAQINFVSWPSGETATRRSPVPRAGLPISLSR